MEEQLLRQARWLGHGAAKQAWLSTLKDLPADQRGVRITWNGAKMDEENNNIGTIAGSLQRLSGAGGSWNFLIVMADPQRNCYIQAAGGKRDPLLYLEAVGPRYLHGRGEPFPLAELQRLGWQVDGRDPQGNLYRYWRLDGEADSRVLAGLIAETFERAYGVPAGKRYVMEMGLD